MTSDDHWLGNYYSKVQAEYQISFNKKDLLTNWALTVLLAMFASYFGLLNIPQLTDVWYKFALIVGTLIILIQFFVNSLLAYGFLKKWRYIKEEIEIYWTTKDPMLIDKIVENMKNYDHGRRMNTGLKDMIWAQLRAGFLPVLSAPIFLLLIESSKITTWTNEYYYAIGIFIIYICWQIVVIKGYDQFKSKSKSQNN